MTRFALGLTCALALALTTAPSAGAFVFWSNKYDDAIGRADDNAGGADQAFVHGLPPMSHPVSLAVRGAHLYWSNYEAGDTIGRVNLDGSCLDSSFIRGAHDPVGVATDGAHVYWANAGTGAIGRANLDGSGANQAFVTGLGRPYGLAVNATHLYWSNIDTGKIWRANLDGTGPAEIVTATAPSALALDASHLYWADGTAGAIGRANLDGTSPEPAFISAPVNPWGVAVDAGHVWWTDQGPPKTVGRADLDAGNPDNSFLPASADGVYGVAVGPAATPVPCPPAPVRPTTGAQPRDATAPALRRLKLSRSRFAAARRGASISKLRVGTVLRFALSESAVVRFRVARRGARRPLKGSFSRRGRAGTNRARFSGRLRRRALRPGHYRLQLTATDAAGNRSRRAAVRFVINRR